MTTTEPLDRPGAFAVQRERVDPGRANRASRPRNIPTGKLRSPDGPASVQGQFLRTVNPPVDDDLLYVARIANIEQWITIHNKQVGEFANFDRA